MGWFNKQKKKKKQESEQRDYLHAECPKCQGELVGTYVTQGDGETIMGTCPNCGGFIYNHFYLVGKSIEEAMKAVQLNNMHFNGLDGNDDNTMTGIFNHLDKFGESSAEYKQDLLDSKLETAMYYHYLEQGAFKNLNNIQCPICNSSHILTGEMYPNPTILKDDALKTINTGVCATCGTFIGDTIIINDKELGCIKQMCCLATVRNVTTMALSLELTKIHDNTINSDDLNTFIEDALERAFKIFYKGKEDELYITGKGNDFLKLYIEYLKN